jgi:hypothetical protein
MSDFNKNVGKPITKKEAEEWIEKFDKERKKDTRSVFYGRDAIEAILSDSRASGISFFFVRKYDKARKQDIDDIVMVGTMEDGTLLWDAPSSDLNKGATSQAYDASYPCPPYCTK